MEYFLRFYGWEIDETTFLTPETLRNLQHMAEAISLALTPATITMSLVVVCLWRRAAVKYAFLPNKTAEQWFIVGVCAGFVGSVMDNLYWSIPWTASYLGLEAKGSLVDMGVFFNVPFRQTAGILAGYCHARSAFLYFSSKAKDRLLTFLLVGSLSFGVATAVGMFFLRRFLVH